MISGRLLHLARSQDDVGLPRRRAAALARRKLATALAPALALGRALAPAVALAPALALALLLRRAALREG